MQAQADLLQVPVLICRSPDATALGVAALARLGLGDAASAAEAVGPAEVETVVEPSITADQAAERLAVFRAAARPHAGLAMTRPAGATWRSSGPGVVGTAIARTLAAYQLRAGAGRRGA